MKDVKKRSCLCWSKTPCIYDKIRWMQASFLMCQSMFSISPSYLCEQFLHICYLCHITKCRFIYRVSHKQHPVSASSSIPRMKYSKNARKTVSVQSIIYEENTKNKIWRHNRRKGWDELKVGLATQWAFADVMRCVR